jgi:hypothetical protein
VGSCSDIDECALGFDDCHPDADCLNAPGGFNCRCKAGLAGDGKTLCAPFPSCEALHGAQPSLADGVYPLAPDGADPAEAFQAYCDMTSDGGGWTLVMKLVSGTDTFAFESPYWEDIETLNETDLSPNASATMASEAKYPAFHLVAGEVLRLGWLDPADHDFSHSGLAGRTALELFQGGEELLAGDESGGCQGPLLVDAEGYLASHMRHAEAHQFFGTNGEDTANGDTGQVRFGFGSNDEAFNAWDPRQGAGANDASLLWSSADDCNACACYGNAYEARQTAANLWVR